MFTGLTAAVLLDRGLSELTQQQQQQRYGRYAANIYNCYYYNNINNSHDNVYGAVIMTEVIARVHPVHLMNVD